MTYYIYNTDPRLKSEKEKMKINLIRKIKKFRTLKCVKFSNKNFFRGK